MKRYGDAAIHYRQALAIREKLFGAEDKIVALTLYHLATALAELGQDDEALALYGRRLAVESHEVIDIQSGSADGLKSFYPGMRSVPIVVVQPFGELTGSVV